jgi:hypothetical protein
MLGRTEFDSGNIRPYAFKPFDVRKCYYFPIPPLWNDPRVELARQCRDGNKYIVTRPGAVAEAEGVPFFLTAHLTDGDLMRGHAHCIPIRLYDENNRAYPNLSPAMLEYLDALGVRDAGDSGRAADLVWHHVLAIGFSPAYLSVNSVALRYGWPRIPFPLPDESLTAKGACALLQQSATLGELLAAVLNPELNPKSKFPPLKIAQSMDPFLSIASLDPEYPWDFHPDHILSETIPLEGKWGYRKSRGRREDGEGVSKDNGGTSTNVMLGNGRLLRRNYTNWERMELEKLGADMGLHAGAVYAALGNDTCDIFINDYSYWSNVPSGVWEYRIGGYPVLRKWLSYREYAILGRGLYDGEVAAFSRIVHQLTALRLLESGLDRNFAEIRDHGGAPAGARDTECVPLQCRFGSGSAQK